MFRLRRIVGIAACIMMLVSCENTTFQSSVPRYPVRVVIDTKLGAFVHFQPTAINTYVIVNKDGYFMNGQKILPLGATDMYGYAGVVVYINSLCGYDAYDLCCPNCVSYRQACEIDGLFAVCPRCGEHYDLASGTAVPQKGIADEYMRRLTLMVSDGKITVSQ